MQFIVFFIFRSKYLYYKHKSISEIILKFTCTTKNSINEKNVCKSNLFKGKKFKYFSIITISFCEKEKEFLRTQYKVMKNKFFIEIVRRKLQVLFNICSPLLFCMNMFFYCIAFSVCSSFSSFKLYENWKKYVIFGWKPSATLLHLYKLVIYL